MIDIEMAGNIYGKGLGYSYVITLFGFFIFSCWRWCKAVNVYIETGQLDNLEASWFWTKKWLFADEQTIKLYHSDNLFKNHPLIVAIDLIYAVFILFMASLAWPITFIVISIVVYAKIMRAGVRKKQEFIKRLAGEES